ncbi:MAG: hypothetical protein IJ058_12210 [Lachnospiraceae bacterium]|nr:hypothetical protein [Lachnospiraceae bacterium]
MRKIITRGQAVRYAIWSILAILILAVFPCRIFREKIESSGKESPAGAVSVGGENVLLQEFKAEYDHISSIGFYLKGEYYSDTLTFRVFKESTGELLREITVSTDDFHRIDGRTFSGSGEGYADIYVNLDTVVGDGYFYTVEGLSTDFEIPFELTGNSGTYNNGFMQYAGENKDAYNAVTRYIYTQPLRKIRSLILIAILAATGAVLTALALFLEKRVKFFGELTTPAWMIRVIANPLIVAGGIAAVIAVGPLHMFSIYIADIIIMIIGILLLAAILLYAVNFGLPGTDIRISDEPYNASAYIPGQKVITLPTPVSFLQSLFIALALLYCVHYMNALYEVFHDIAWRKMAFFLGLAVIVSFKFRDLVNIWNLILLIAGIVVSRIYYVRNLPDMVDEYHTDAMLGTCLCIPVILVLIGCFVTQFVKRGRTVPMIQWIKRTVPVTQIIYPVATVVLVAGMIIRRNGRYWPIVAAVIGVVYFVRLALWEKRMVFLDNLTRGILLHFAGAVIYCLMHRPYEAFEYVRFPFVFHTVTITAEYMALVMAAAFVRLFAAYRCKHRLSDCKWEMFVFGTASVYTLFTMSRTAMIGIVAAGLTMWIAYSYKDREHGRIRNLCVSAGGVIMGVLICFPIFFTAQKALPGVIGQPRLLEIERYPQDLLISKDYESEEYITITRFSKAFIHKMLGMDEDKIKWDLYTVNGKRDDIYVDYSEYLTGGTEVSHETVTVPDGELLLSAENGRSVLPSKFAPPHAYGEEGEPPAEWWDEDYWVYYPETGEWEFATWKLEEEAAADVTNGRLDIYRAYIEQLNREGHEEMGAILPDGEIAAHAHNIYLQVAYDNGKIIGIMFIIWVVLTCIRALNVFIRIRDCDPAAGILLSVSVTYAVCGVTEWISHPCNPAGMVMMLVSAVLCLPVGSVTCKADL